MRPPTRGRRLGIPRLGVPWLGLPLSGLLAWTAVGQSLWTGHGAEAPLADEQVHGGAAASEVSPAALGVDSGPRPLGRPADLAGELKLGETLGTLFSRRLGLSSAEAQAAASASSRFVDLRQLRAGSDWRAYLSDQGRLERFELAVEGRGELILDRIGKEWQPAFANYRRESRLQSVRGRIEGSLEGSIDAVGAPVELAYAMADVLQWDLDFARDLQPGDEFRVLYEEVSIERSRPAVGHVIAIEYGRADGRRLEAYRFDAGAAGDAKTSAGYYDGEGRPLAKMFLRSPLPYSRVTSKFSHKRLHPVLGVFRPHYGVDYGAPTGTPVRVTASGTVVSATWDGGGGRTVKVRHANDFLTAYLHLSRFAGGVRPGSRVRQGDVIGYVGSSGLATAPHLDYRIQQNGRWIDPLSLKIVPAEPVSPLRLADFRAVRDAMRHSLESGAPYEPPAFAAERAANQVADEGNDGPHESTSGRASGAT